MTVEMGSTVTSRSAVQLTIPATRVTAPSSTQDEDSPTVQYADTGWADWSDLVSEICRSTYAALDDAEDHKRKAAHPSVLIVQNGKGGLTRSPQCMPY
jgi:hypothetical protein